MNTRKLLKKLINTLNEIDYIDHGDDDIKSGLLNQLENDPLSLVDQLLDIIQELS